MNNLMEIFNMASGLATKKKRTNKKGSSKKRKKQTSNSSKSVVNESLFGFLFNNSNNSNSSKVTTSNVNTSSEDKKEEEKANVIQIFNSFVTTESKKITNTAKKIKDTVLDLIVTKDTVSDKPSERYRDNKMAIKLIKALNNAEKKASTNEQKILSKYVGWGGLANAFVDDESELKKLLGDDFESAKRSVNTAFFTRAVIVKYIWKVLLKLGFEKGRILEPSIGTGNMFRYSSEDMYYNSKVVGVEMDTITSEIASQLLQSATIINSRYEEANLKDDSFDLVISNIPFGDIKVFDKECSELNGLYVHDYYFLKSIKKVRDKGIIAFVTSTGVMDKRNSEIREEIEKYCDFLGAVRLPSGAFSDTKVVSDIIFLQKNLDKSVDVAEDNDNEDDDNKKRNSINRNWIKSVPVKKTSNDEDLYINEYFVNNPEMILGSLTVTSSRFGEALTVISEKSLSMDIFNKTLKYFPNEVYVTPIDDTYMYEEEELKQNFDENIKDGEFILEEDKIYQKQKEYLIPSSYTGTRREKLELYINIKDTVKKLIKEQLDGCSDEVLKELQSELNGFYDTFVKKFGYINARGNKSLLNQCIQYSLISALENYDLETKTYTKADIFTKRTIGVEKEFIPKTIDDAICLSFTTFGHIDIEFMAEKLERKVDDIKNELIENETLFINPQNNSELIYRDEYLSGYVKEKLEIAKEMAEINPAIKRNVNALEKVQPEYVTDVAFNFGSTWIPIKVKSDFIVKTLSLDADKFKMLYTKAVGYTLEYSSYIAYGLKEVEWGTKRRDALRIVSAILNLGDLTVIDTEYVDGKEKRVKNIEETQLALNMAEKWKAEFVNYVNSDVDLLKELTDIYNDLFNNYVERKYSNIFKSINVNPNIHLREHQLAAVSRMIQSPNNTLLAHSVGTGKSYTMMAYAEEIRRIGENMRYKNSNGEIVNKPIKHKSLFIIPNHLCKSNQFAKEYLTLYPQAKILATSPEDFKKANRRKLISKIALGDWTSVIIPYSVLGMIPLKPTTEIEMLERSLDELESTLEFYSKNESSISVKDMEKAKENFQAKIQELSNRRVDNGLLYWEDLGITNIIVDEAHNYKNLFFPKKLQVAGVTNTAAKKAQDLFNKISYHRDKFGEGNVIFSTATPISNSMVEMFTMMKYLNISSLEKHGIDNFDAFAANFGEIVANMEIDPTGKGFRLNRRFAKFCNLPELVSIFRQVADVVNIQDIADLDIPKHIEGKPNVITVYPTEAMEEYIDELVERAKKISNGGVNPKEDNMLNVTNEGRKVAVAPRLVGIDEDSPKLMKVADDVKDIYEKYPNGTQLLFCDLGTPKDDGSYSIYSELKEHCINRGIPAEEIKFIHDAKTNDQRTKMISDFNEGNFKILIGSTALCGEGVNFQKKVINITHIDVPWKPSSIEQRNGRAFRQGNENKEIFENRYVTNSSFYAYSWQIVEFKAKYITQIISANSTARVADDLESSTLTYEACKACAANNPKLLELATVKENIQKLRVMEKAFKRQLLSSISRKESLKRDIEDCTTKLAHLKAQLELVNYTKTFSIELEGVTYTNPAQAAEKLGELLDGIESKDLGSIYGMPIKMDVETSSGYVSRYIVIGTEYKLIVKKKQYPKLTLNDIVDSYTRLIELKTHFEEELSQNKLDQNSLQNLKTEFDHKDELQELILKQKALENELALESNLQK
ncbi:helicase-related protein (plasmid) [Clostridium perfringens]